MYTIGQWLSKKNNRKPLKTIHNSHIQLYLCHNPSKTGMPVHSANHVGRVVCVFTWFERVLVFEWRWTRYTCFFVCYLVLPKKKHSLKARQGHTKHVRKISGSNSRKNGVDIGIWRNFGFYAWTSLCVSSTLYCLGTRAHLLSVHLLRPPLDHWYTAFFFLAGPGPLHEIAVSAFFA